jgi:hypothetical protein
MGLVTPPTVTRTSTMPEPAGALAVHAVPLVQDTLVAGFGPKATAVAPAAVENPVPIMATVFPPTGGPCPGLTPVTVGMVIAVWVMVVVPLLPPLASFAVTVQDPATIDAV